MSTVLNISRVPHDLHDGRVLAVQPHPDAKATKVELTDHERGLADAGHILVLDRQGRDQTSRISPPADAAEKEE